MKTGNPLSWWAVRRRPLRLRGGSEASPRRTAHQERGNLDPLGSRFPVFIGPALEDSGRSGRPTPRQRCRALSAFASATIPPILHRFSIGRPVPGALPQVDGCLHHPPMIDEPNPRQPACGGSFASLRPFRVTERFGLV